MTFTPVVPIGGYAGWSFLKRTMTQQAGALRSQPSEKRDEAYFREKIGTINTAEQLVSDRRLLRIALTAFGLQDDIGNKFFIQKILEGGTLKEDALANRLANKQYEKFSSAFGFGDFSTPRNKLSDFADKILETYWRQQFAVAVGTQNGDMRLALNVEKELTELADESSSSLSKWYAVLGSPPLRQVFEKAFGLPSAFGAIDIDRQVETLQQRMRATFGSDEISQFKSPEVMEKLVRQFLVRSEIAAPSAASTPGQMALVLLQQANYRFRN